MNSHMPHRLLHKTAVLMASALLTPPAANAVPSRSPSELREITANSPWVSSKPGAIDIDNKIVTAPAPARWNLAKSSVEQPEWSAVSAAGRGVVLQPTQSGNPAQEATRPIQIRRSSAREIAHAPLHPLLRTGATASTPLSTRGTDGYYVSGAHTDCLQVWIGEGSNASSAADIAVSAMVKTQVNLKKSCITGSPTYAVRLVPVRIGNSPTTLSQTLTDNWGDWWGAKWNQEVAESSWIEFTALTNRGAQTVVGLVTVLQPRARQTQDAPDMTTRKQIHLVYVVPSDDADEHRDADGTLQNIVLQAQRYLHARTGKILPIDGDVTGQPDITYLRSDHTEAQLRDADIHVADLLEPEVRGALNLRTSDKTVAYVIESRSNGLTQCNGASSPDTLSRAWMSIVVGESCSDMMDSGLTRPAVNLVRSFLRTLGVAYVPSEADVMCDYFSLANCDMIEVDPARVLYADTTSKYSSRNVLSLDVWGQMPKTAPSPPREVHAQPASTGVDVAWSEPVSTGGSPIIGYTATATPSGRNCSTSGELMCTITGLSTSVVYAISVTAKNAVGTSISSAGSAGVSPMRPPSAPIGLRAEKHRSIAGVWWTPPADFGGASKLTYNVAAHTASSDKDLTCSVLELLSCSISGLDASIDYTFSVTAENDAGASPKSAAARVIRPGFDGYYDSGRSTSCLDVYVGDGPNDYAGTNIEAGAAVNVQVNASRSCFNNRPTYTIRVVPLRIGADMRSVNRTLTDNWGSNADWGARWNEKVSETSWIEFSAVTDDGPQTVVGLVTVRAPQTRQMRDAADSTSRKKIHLFYVVPRDGIDRHRDTDGSVRDWVLQAQRYLYARTGKLLPIDRDASGNPDITFLASIHSDAELIDAQRKGGDLLLDETRGAVNGNAIPVFLVESTRESGFCGYARIGAFFNEDGRILVGPLGVASCDTMGKSGVSWLATAIVHEFFHAIGVHHVPHESDIMCDYEAMDCSGGQTTIDSLRFLYAGASSKFSSGDILSLGIWADVVGHAPSTVQTVVATPAINGVALAWQQPLDDGGALVTSFTVTASPGGRSCTTAQLSCSINGLEPKRAYTFSVVATSVFGSSATTLPTAAVSPLSAPAAPAGINGIGGDGFVTVWWNGASEDGGSPITAYTATAFPSGRTCTTVLLSCTIAGLSNGTRYQILVTAANIAGMSPPSSSTPNVTAAACPSIPGAVSTTPGNTQVVVVWSEPAYDGGSPIVGYTATASPGGQACTALAFSCTISGLTNGTSYAITVVATNVSGDSQPRSAQGLATPFTRPGPPSKLRARVRGTGQAVVTWAATPANDSPVTRYELAYKIAGAKTFSAWKACGVRRQFTLGNLIKGKRYQVVVKAVNPAGSTSSAVLTFAQGR